MRRFDSNVDPETGSPYVYRVIGSGPYETCAIFATECRDSDRACARWRAKQDVQISGHGAGEERFRISPSVLSGCRVP